MLYWGTGRRLKLEIFDNLILILDAYEGQLLGKFTSHENDKSLPLEISYTPDSNYILSGSGDGKIHIWSSKL